MNVALGLLRPGQPVPDLVISQTCVRAKDRFIEFVMADHATVVDLHIAGHRQTIDIGVQRTQAIREFFRQHRNHPAWEIDRIAALAGLTIERGSGPHIVADVGNSHHQAPPSALAFGENRIVEVSGRLAINGHQTQRAQILSPFSIGGSEHVRQRRRLGEGAAGELEGQLVLAQSDFYLHARIGVVAEHFDDASDRL
jgi:hypothetical protein